MISYGVTIRMKPFHLYFHIVLLIQFVVVPTFESVDDILWCYHSNETFLGLLSHGMVLFIPYVVLTFESVDESYCVTIQMKPPQQYFHVAQLI